MATDFFAAPNSSMTDHVSWGQYLNSITDDFFGSAILMILYVILFFVLKQNTTGVKAFTAASMISGILAIALLNWGLIDVSLVLLLLFMTIGGAIFARNQEGN